MKFAKKLSALTLSAVLFGSSLVPVSASKISEISGLNRYETAAKIADNIGNYNTAILVNSDKSLADGLSASSLAGKENAPILLVKKDSIPNETMTRLQNVDKVYIIGGNAAISKNVENQLSDKEIIRIEGKNRIETSEKVAELVGDYNEAFIVNGNKGEADAMSVAAVAARDKAPILLTNGNSTNQKKISGVNYYAIGGEVVVSNSLVSKFGAVRLSGSDRYKTNKEVVEKFYNNSNKLYYAKGNPLVDALTVSLLAKDNGVVLVSKNSDKSILKDKDIVQVGGMDFVVNPNNSNPEITSVTDTLEFNLGEMIDLDLYGVVATDPEDGDITDKIMVKEIPNIFEPGTYKLELMVEDSSGAAFYKTLTLIINDTWVDDNNGENPEEENQNKPNKPTEKTYNINSPEFQNIVRKEFYRILDDYREEKGCSKAEHHWAFEESTLAKSKHMIENNYFDHDPWIETPHVRSASENIAGQWVTEEITEREGKALANRIFNQWKNSHGHNMNMLSNYGTIIDGFSFYAKESNYSEDFGDKYIRRGMGKIYMVKATYQSGGPSNLR